MGYTAGLCTPGNQPEIKRLRERERERERRTQGPKSLVEQGWFIEFCVSIYTILQGSFFRYQTLQVTKETRSNRGHKAKRQSISKEGHR